MSTGKGHLSLKRLLRNAATITLFTAGACHQTQTAKATDWSYDFANSVYSQTSSTAIPNNTNTTWNSASEPTGAPTIYTRSSTSSNPLGYGIQVVNGGDTNLGSGGELNLFGGVSASGTFFSFNDWTASKYYDVRFSAVLQGSGSGAYAQISIGDGASFAGNNALTAGQIAAGLKLTFGASNAITTTWNPASGTAFGTTNGTVTTTGITSNGSATAGTVLNIRIVGNNDTTAQTYSISGVNYTIAPNKYDIFLNGVLIGDDISALLTGANVDSLNFSLFGAASSTSALKLDNITISNTLTAAVLLGNFWNGGTGTWTSTSPNWSTSAALGGAGTSDSSSTNPLVFGGTAGTVTVSGTVTVPAGMNFTTTGYTLSGGTINLSGTSAAANTLTIDGGSSTASISSVLTGTNGLTKAGTGTLNLSGANTYSGTTAVSAGTLQLGSGTALGTSSMSITAGAALDLAGVTMVNANALTVNGTGISNNGVLINSSTTTASYRGAITLGSDSTITADTGNITLTGGITTASGKSLTINGVKDVTVSTVKITGAGGLTKSGNGRLNLNFANDFTGGLTINGGTVSLGYTGALNATAGSENAVTFGSGSTGTLSLNGNNATIASLNTNPTPGTTFVQNGSTSAGTATLTIGNSTNSNSTFAGVIQNGSTGVLALNKAGTGTLTLTNANTYTGGTAINQGKIVLNGGSLATGTVSVANNATLATSGVASAGSLSLVNGANLDLTSAGLSLSGSFTASGGNLSYTLGNTLAVTGALTLSGTVNISLAGTFVDKTRYTLLTFSSSDASNLNVTTTRLGWTITPVITATSYSVDIAIASASLNWNLSGDGTWDATTAANWYNSKNSSTQAFTDGDNVTFDKSTGGIIDITSTVTPGSVTVNSSGDYTFQSGTIAGDGGIIKSGNGKLTLSAANTFNGEVVVNAGTLAVTNASALGATSTGTRIISGATFDISGNITLVAEPLTLAGSGVAGVGALTSSTGTNTISGPITLSASALITSQGISGIDILTLAGALSGSNSTLSIGGTADTTISGNISGSSLALNKVGDGTLTLSGTSNTYTGGTTITGGKLIAATTNLTGNITANAILQIDQTANGSFAGNISGSGELIKEGTGTVTLSGTNSVGTITLNNGTLVIASSTALPTSGTLAVTGGSLLTLSAAGSYGASTQTVTLTPTNATSPALNIGSGNAVTLASNLVIGSQTQIAVPGAGGVLTLSGVLTGTGKLFKTDLGKLIISGASNGMTGSTEIQNGILTINAGSTFGTGSLTMNAQGGLATLELNESATVSSLVGGITSANNIISLATGKTLTINESSVRTFGTTVGSNTFTINGLGGLTMAGSGELILDSTNSYTGLTSVTSGTLTANNSAAISSSVSVSSGAILNLQDNQNLTSLAGSGEVRIADGKTFTLNNSSTQTFGGTFTATSGTAFTKSGAGTLNLSGASTQLARDITLSAGTVKASNNNALGSGTVLIGTGGSGTTGTLYVAKDKTIANNITIGTVAASGINTSALQNLLTFDFSGLTTFGASPLTGTTNAAIGANYTGLTRASAITTPAGGSGSTWGGASMTATSAAAAVTANQFVTFGFKSTTNSLKLDTNSILPYINYRSNAGADQVQWAYSINGGAYTDFGSILTIGTTNSAVTTLTSFPSNLILNANDQITFRMAVFKVTSAGSGNWYLKDQANTTADFGIQGYVLSSYNNPAWGSGVLGIDEAGTATFTGNIVVNNTAELTAATGGTAIFNTGVMSGLGSLTKTGNGTVVLQGDNTFTGSLTLSAGNLKVSTLGAGGTASPLGAAADVPGSIIFRGGNLEYAGSGETLTRDFTVGNDGAGFISSGSGALVIGQDAQMDFDNATASNRTLSLGGTTDIAVENIFNPKKFDSADITNLFTKLVKQDVNKWVVLGAGAGFVDDAATEMDINGGELDFAMGSLGSSSHKAHINVGSATLGWYNGNTDDLSGRIYLNNSATSAFNVPSGTVTLASALNGGAATTASLTKLGNGTLQLGAANNFSGGLTVSAGTVKATATGSVGSGTVTISRNATFVVNTILANRIDVKSGATLAGNGTDEDATIEEGGILSPNADSIGTLSFNKLALNGGAHVKWQLQDAKGAAGVGYDTLVVSVINLNNASSSKKIHVDVTSTGSFLNFDKTKLNKFEFAKLTNALAMGVNVTDLFSIDASQFEIDNNLINDHLVWSMQLSADRDVMYVTTMIPEPSTYGLGLSALALAVVAVRRRKKKKI